MSATVQPFTSFFLDGVRAFAAVGVVFSHLATTKLAPHADGVHPYGHLMVVCFFVLSGMLIAASVRGRQMTLERYAALRLGRLWSVAVPCLTITAVLHGIAYLIAAESLPLLPRALEPVRYGLAAGFVNELWFFSAGPTFNTPVWSLAYEAWYYLLFGLAVLVTHRGWKIAALVMACLLAGPKILLLLPIWLTGVALAMVLEHRGALRRWGWPILLVSTAVLAIMVAGHFRWPTQVGSKPWFFSSSWASDFVSGCAVAGVILGVDLCWGARTPLRWLDEVIRRAAGVSFTLYLLHFPLMCFAATVLPQTERGPWQVGLTLAAIFGIVYVLGSWIEPQRKAWTARIESLLAGLKPKLRNAPALVVGRAAS